MTIIPGRKTISPPGARRPFVDDLKEHGMDLLREWRMMFRPSTLLADIQAGIAVALVALPLSLAIANASGVSPTVGLATAIVGGIAVALFGGCRLQVSGPDAAMQFLVYEILTKYGFDGLIAATVMAGLFQIGTGLLGLGRFIRLLPRPVVAGFLSGIGLTILSTQLPVLLGVEVSHDEEGGAMALLWQTVARIRQFDLAALVVGITSVTIMFGLPRFSKRLPIPLVAVAVASVLPLVFGWSDVALIGAIPSGFPSPSLPRFPWGVWNELVLSSVAIFVMASLSSLLSASVVDTMAKGTRTDHNRELFGQGIGNLASAWFGGIPVAGVIARTATNIRAGARTRLAAVVHALVLLGMLFGLSTLIARVPRAALAGVLVAVALRMTDFGLLRALWRTSRAEAFVFLATAGTIVSTDLIVGIPVGMIGAFAIVVYEMSRLDLRTIPLTEHGEHDGGEGDAHACTALKVMRVEGSLFFASGYHLRTMVNRLDGYRCLVLDLERVPFLDVTGAEALEEIIESLGGLGCEVILSGPNDSVFRRITGLGADQFPALRDAALHGDLRDAILHASAKIGEADLCRDCRNLGRCAAIGRAFEEIGELKTTAVPTVRAVVPRREGDIEASVVSHASNNGVGSPPRTTKRPTTSEPLRGTPVTSWNRRRALPTIHSSAFVDPLAVVIGEVTVGDRVYIGPGVSVRADEGTPFHIGAGTNLQDGVTLHALKGKVVLVGGRPFAIHIGRNVCLTHHSLIHGPCHVGDGCFIGFKATVHDAIVGENCVLGLGAVVVGVRLPPGRYVGHNQVVDTQEKADALPPADDAWHKLREDVVEVNRELADGHREAFEAHTPETTAVDA
jgi:SulP family sulfate permease